MKFGTKVYVTRGSAGIKQGERGCLRKVKGTLISAYRDNFFVRLEEDDPLDTVGWDKKLMVGAWCKSAIEENKDG